MSRPMAEPGVMVSFEKPATTRAGSFLYRQPTMFQQAIGWNEQAMPCRPALIRIFLLLSGQLATMVRAPTEVSGGLKRRDAWPSCLNNPGVFQGVFVVHGVGDCLRCSMVKSSSQHA